MLTDTERSLPHRVRLWPCGRVFSDPSCATRRRASESLQIDFSTQPEYGQRREQCHINQRASELSSQCWLGQVKQAEE